MLSDADKMQFQIFSCHCTRSEVIRYQLLVLRVLLKNEDLIVNTINERENL